MLDANNPRPQAPDPGANSNATDGVLEVCAGMRKGHEPDGDGRPAGFIGNDRHLN